MKWDDIRESDGSREICVTQEKTGTKVWIPLHRDLKALLDETPRVSDHILVSARGRPFATSQSLYGKIKPALKRIGEGKHVPHGLRANAAVRLIEAGCDENRIDHRPPRYERLARLPARPQSKRVGPSGDTGN